MTTIIREHLTPDITTIARVAIGAILDGQPPPNGVHVDDLGQFGDVYGEMIRAYKTGGTAAARRAYEAYARRDPALARLISGDPQPAKHVWTADDLLSAEFPDPKWAVPGLLPAGLVVLAGRPKLGKSWLSLQIAGAVGTGGRVLGKQVERGRVLYLALEDNPRRLKDRLAKQRSPRGVAVDFRFEWPALVGKNGAQPGTTALIEAISQNGYSLVVIDTISRALGHADQLDQADMNVAFGSLQRMAMERDICLLLVDHHRKGAGGVGDVVDDVMGATSKVGVADAAIGIYRERGQAGATLKVAGRDVDDQELAITFDRDLFCWQLIGSVAEVTMGDQKQGVLDAIRSLGNPTHREIADATGQDRGNCFKRIQDLVAEGKVRRVDGRPVRFEVIE